MTDTLHDWSQGFGVIHHDFLTRDRISDCVINHQVQCVSGTCIDLGPQDCDSLKSATFCSTNGLVNIF